MHNAKNAVSRMRQRQMGPPPPISEVSSNQGERAYTVEYVRKKKNGAYTFATVTVFDNCVHIQVVKFLADVSQQLTSDQALSSLEAIATMVSSSTGQSHLIPRVCLHCTCLSTVNSVSGLLACLNGHFPQLCETEINLSLSSMLNVPDLT